MYYLNSRYYDSETGRFINADDISYLDPETINGLNLYSYCANNAVMNIDPNGANWFKKAWNSISSWTNNNIIQPIVGGVTTATDWIANNSEAIIKTTISVASIVGGVALCFVPGAQAIGAGLIIFGAGGIIGGVVGAVTGYGYNEGWSIGAIIGGAIGLAVAAPQLLNITTSLTLPTFGWMSTGAGSLIFGVTGSIAISIPVGAMAVGTAAASLLGSVILFASDNRPGNNQKQNEQYREAMRRLGYDKTDWQWRYGHDHLPKKGMGFKELLEFLRKLFGR